MASGVARIKSGAVGQQLDAAAKRRWPLAAGRLMLLNGRPVASLQLFGLKFPFPRQIVRVLNKSLDGVLSMRPQALGKLLKAEATAQQ